MLTFLAGTGAGILLALLLGHLERRRVSRRQRELARLFCDMQTAILDVQDIVALGVLEPDESEAAERREIWRERRQERDDAIRYYYRTLRGE